MGTEGLLHIKGKKDAMPLGWRMNCLKNEGY